MGDDGVMAAPIDAPATVDRVVAAAPIRRSWVHSAWLGPVAGLLALLLTVTLGGAVAGNWIVANAQMHALLTAVQGSETDMTKVQDEVTAAFHAYGALKSPTAADQDRLNASLSNIATDGASQVGAAGQQVADVAIAPWNTALLHAQHAYEVHNQAWVNYLAAAALNPLEFTKNQPAINSSWRVVQKAFPAALPVPALYGMTATVHTLFTDPVAPPAQSGTGGAPANGLPPTQAA